VINIDDKRLKLLSPASGNSEMASMMLLMSERKAKQQVDERELQWRKEREEKDDRLRQRKPCEEKTRSLV
jgi:hypothetical protein